MSNFEIKKQASAGTLESSDIHIIIDKNDNNGIEIELQSAVEKQYGKRIRQVIKNTLTEMGIMDAKIAATDKGALDCTIIARTMAAVHRSSEITTNYNWEEMDSWNV